MYGYMNRILRVDLTSGRIWDEPLNETYARDFVGGSGLGARYLAAMAGPDTDPLGPENPLIFMTGPFVGTQVPAAGRYEVVARSPQTGFTGEANSGGFFGPAMRQAGYDGIIVTGRSEKPVYLSVVEGQEPTLHPAEHLWGLDSYATQQRVQEELKLPKAKVACIGPAGEYMVRYAAIMNDAGRAAARTGLGAVMGSKNLKAIAAFGKAKVPIADEATFRTTLQQTFHMVQEDVQTQLMRLGGTMMYPDVGAMYGDSPAKYYSQTGLPEAEETITAGHMVDTIFLRAAACFRCPIMCNREVHLDNYQEPKVDGPEFETAMGFGPNVGSGDLEGATYAGHLCNLLGMDTISASSTIGFAYYLYNEGIITEQDTGGLTLEWGDLKTVHELLRQAACREGFGAQLADGALALGRRYGVPDLAVQVKNLEASYHDPRAFTALGIVYALAPRGADHMSGDAYIVEQGRELPEMGIHFGDRFEESRAKVEMACNLMDWRALTNSLILCHFEEPGGDLVLGLVNSVTGWNTDWDELHKKARRIFTLKRMLNHRFGMTRQDDGLPKLLRKSLPEGGTGGYVPDLETLLPLAYEVEGWDPETGVPTEETLENLGLGWMSQN